MAAFDQYLKSVPKIPFVNVSSKTVPPFGVVRIYGIDEYGYFEVSTPGTETVSGAGSREPDEIRGSEWATSGVAREWGCAFNLGNSVEPGNRGYCYTNLPAIVPVAFPYDDERGLVYGDILSLIGSEFKLILSSSAASYQYVGGYRIGWPFIARVPNTSDLVIIGGLISFEMSSARE